MGKVGFGLFVYFLIFSLLQYYSHMVTSGTCSVPRNGLAKLGLRDELLCRSLLPALLRRITEKSKWEAENRVLCQVQVVVLLLKTFI